MTILHTIAFTVVLVDLLAVYLCPRWFVALVMWMTLGLFTAALALLVVAVAAAVGVGP